MSNNERITECRDRIAALRQAQRQIDYSHRGNPGIPWEYLPDAQFYQLEGDIERLQVEISQLQAS